jgi:TonB-dependent SusC/RagA subfamily outer membrane receptor
MGFISTNGFSQTKFTGTVISENDAPLSKATITLKGSNQSVTSDEAGHFTLNSDAKKGTLLISYVGYETEIVSIQANQTDFTVKLRVLQQQLNEAVVVGYGTQKKKDLTGSVSSVNSDHMNLGGTTSNIAQAIQGRAAGVQVQQSDFSPGGSIAITIRGGNSINTTNEPLYVVDGLISDNGKFINPNDIEDIQILKDASATAIYGARGGNGVVLITTKKGKAGKMLLEADASNGTQYLTYTPSLLNGTQYATIQNAIAAEDSKPPVFPSSFPIANTNWFKNTTQQASVLNRTISFSGNDKTSKLYLSGNYFKQDGVLKHTTLSVTQ